MKFKTTIDFCNKLANNIIPLWRIRISSDSYESFSCKMNSTEKVKFSIEKLVVLLVLAAMFYFFFGYTCGFIYRIHDPVDLNVLSPWVICHLLINDGIELYVMTLAMPVYLVCAYYISISKPLNLVFLHKPVFLGLYVLIPVVAFTCNTILKEPISLMSFVFCGFSALVSFAICYLCIINISKLLRRVLNGLFFLFLIGLGFVINDHESIFDWGFLIGPASKLLQGEKLGSFYMQYNLLLTSITMIMQKMQLLLHQMQIVLIVIFAVWIILYKKLASIIFKNKVIVYYFLVALIIIRGVAIQGGPISTPQVSPLRLDLWVPMLLVVLILGYESVLTAILFSVMYLLDDTFGFLYLCLYLFMIVRIHSHRFKNTGKNVFSLSMLKFFVPALIALLIHFAIFQTFTSAAGKLYAEYHIGFLPINHASSFWLMVWMLPVCLYILVQEKLKQELIIFVFGLACIQLTYFFGRSHENNLLNISGILVLILFMTIDRFYSFTENKQFAIVLLSLLIGFIVLNYNQSVSRVIKISNSLLEQGIVLENPFESQIRLDGEYLRTLNTDKLILMTDYDSYLNYRLGYKQVGFFSPFSANIKNEETVQFLYKQIKLGYRLIAYPGKFVHIPEYISIFNAELAKISKVEKFAMYPLRNNLMEMKLVTFK